MDINIIKLRRHEVSRELERLEKRITALQSELEELTVAERVIARLSGEDGRAAGSPDEPESSPSVGDDAGGTQMTVRAMIKEALFDARQRGLPGLAPRHIRDYIAHHYHRDVGQQINTTASRMWREVGEIEKDESSGLFSLPSKEKPTGQESVEDRPVGLFSNPAQGREAGPGGGT
ncbi:hypothetical protein ACKTEK_00875 [Tepidamorphus sp. 3E244]|uniref:hypothetical protein n=1 Tax=Tepidamorphus sp. 3E244 TaxID=3385498 RepID=UPI0038FC6818